MVYGIPYTYRAQSEVNNTRKKPLRSLNFVAENWRMPYCCGLYIFDCTALIFFQSQTNKSWGTAFESTVMFTITRIAEYDFFPIKQTALTPSCVIHAWDNLHIVSCQMPLVTFMTDDSMQH